MLLVDAGPASIADGTGGSGHRTLMEINFWFVGANERSKMAMFPSARLTRGGQHRHNDVAMTTEARSVRDPPDEI